ncbi:autotransporter family protein [Ancylobacter terrae]|uniref:autotransporter family protein n=1 Tax=Ancylobacter sp. sgz301288 TaxID=3342077 RepID=UPI00385FD9FE
MRQAVEGFSDGRAGVLARQAARAGMGPALRRALRDLPLATVLATLLASPAFADPPPLTEGPIVYPPGQPGGVQSTLIASERGLDIAFTDITDLTPSVGNDEVIGNASYAPGSGTIIEPEGAFTTTDSFAYSLTETVTTNVTMVGGGITAVVRSGGTVLGSATAATESEARAEALASVEVPQPGGRMLLNPLVSNGGITETVTETTSSVLTGRDTYVGPAVATFGPDTFVSGNLGRCDRPYGSCEGGTTLVLGRGNTLVDVLLFQDLYATTTIDRVITSSGTEYLDFVFAAAGYAHPAVQTVAFDLSDRFLSRLLSPGPAGYGTELLVEGRPSGITVFVEGTGTELRYDADGAIAKSDASFAGLRAGLAGRVREDVLIGLAGEFGTLDWSLKDPLFPEQAEGDAFRIGGFANWTPGAWRVAAAAFAGRQQVESTGISTYGAGISRADYDANVYGAGLDIGYAMAIAGVTVTPSASLGWYGWDAPGFTEVGGLAPLTVAGSTRSQWRPGVGLALDDTVDLAGHAFSFGATGRFFAILGDNEGLVVASDGGMTALGSFTIEGPEVGRFGAELGARAAYAAGENVTLTASGGGLFTDASTSWSGQVGFKVAF